MGPSSPCLPLIYDKFTQTGALKHAWGNIRNLAYIILIPVMLIMVIGTALGFSFIDAYTVKRALPRLLVAIVFMALSWDICRIMIVVTNDVGRGLAGLIGSVITLPDGKPIHELQIQHVFSGGEGIFTTFLGGAAVGGIILVTLANLLPLLIAFLALLGIAVFGVLFITFLLLAFRQMIIFALVILAPLAILSWIFPGNDKLWKLWWNSFSKFTPLIPDHHTADHHR